MESPLYTSLLIFLVALFGYLHSFLGSTMHNRPIIISALTGLVLGDFKTGIMIGLSLEMVFLGAVPLGAFNPPDMVSGAIISTAAVILTKQDTGIAIMFGMLAAITAAFFDDYQMRTLLIKVAHQADYYAHQGDIEKLERLIEYASIGNKIILSAITALIFYFTIPMIGPVSAYIPAFLNKGLNIFVSLLPAVGLASMARNIMDKKLVICFIIAYLLTALFNIETVYIILCSTILISLYYFRKKDLIKINTDEKISQHPELKQLFLRSCTLDSCWNYERQQHLNFCYMMIPVLRKIYHDDPEALKRALKRHLEFMACTPHLVTLLSGICASMEKDNSKDPDYDETGITSIRSSLMAPVSGFGDYLFWTVLLIIAIGAASSFSVKGNFLGPVLFFMIINIPGFLIRYYCLKGAYFNGISFFKKLSESVLIIKITKAASIIALLSLGSMAASRIGIIIPADIEMNFIILRFLPFLIFSLLYFLLSKDIKENRISFILLILCCIGTYLKIL